MEYITKLIHRKEVATGTMAFFFERPDGFSFKAGQYMKFTLLNPPETDTEGNSRLFSITSAPYEKDIMIATRIRDTAFKRVLKTMPLHTTVDMRGPMGAMTLPPNSTEQAIFIAGGIGITPFRSMIRDVVYHKNPRPVTLLYSDKTPTDMAFLSELTNLQKQHTTLTFIPIMTRLADKNHDWKGETGHINIFMIQKYVQNVSESLYYMAGPPSLIEAMREVLAAANVPPRNINFEKFVGY